MSKLIAFCNHCHGNIELNNCSKCTEKKKILAEVPRLSRDQFAFSLQNSNFLNIVKNEVCLYLTEGMPVSFWNDRFVRAYIMTNWDFNQYWKPLLIAVKMSKITMSVAKTLLLMLIPTLEKKNYNPDFKYQQATRRIATVTKTDLLTTFEVLVYRNSRSALKRKSSSSSSS